MRGYSGLKWVHPKSHILRPKEPCGGGVGQSCPTLCDPMDCSPPGSSIHGIFQARVLEWAAISFSRDPFPTQGSNTGPLHCRQMLYHLSHQGSLCLLTKLHSINISYKYMRKVHIKVPVHHCCHLSHSPCQLPKGW